MHLQEEFSPSLVVTVNWVMIIATGLEYLDNFLVLDNSTTSSNESVGHIGDFGEETEEAESVRRAKNKRKRRQEEEEAEPVESKKDRVVVISRRERVRGLPSYCILSEFSQKGPVENSASGDRRKKFTVQVCREV
uniref:Uncharacterized protein n=1 Tax=Knipowitschia caucasica TaxID=637954 RepID=A0AAV2ML51_KNICA